MTKMKVYADWARVAAVAGSPLPKYGFYLWLNPKFWSVNWDRVVPMIGREYAFGPLAFVRYD